MVFENINYFFSFVLGTIVGSFLNSVIYRVYKKEDLIIKRSHCPYCDHPLAWYDLIPVLSFVFLKARCRYCQKKISWQYPLVEMFTGILFSLCFFFFNQNLPFLFYSWIMICFFVLISVYDLKHMIIPDLFLYPPIALTVVYNLYSSFASNQIKSFVFSFLVALVFTGFFLLLFLISKGKWIGFADVKLVFLLTNFLSFPKNLIAIFFSFFTGAFIGLILIGFKKKKMKSEIPFAPFLIFGTLFALFFGQGVLKWYLDILLGQ